MIFSRYILERHIKRDEVIYPKSQLGKFRGEPVYSKSYLVALKTSESWMRLGRVVKSGEQPLKMVKARAVTINKRRELEALKELEKDKGLEQDQDAGVLQGMYAEWQTELYIPMAIVGVSLGFLLELSSELSCSD
jgi:xeroderma pigmentosum group C-complementing protein